MSLNSNTRTVPGFCRMDSEMLGRHQDRDYRANFRQDPGKILVPGNLGGKAWCFHESSSSIMIHFSFYLSLCSILMLIGELWAGRWQSHQ